MAIPKFATDRAEGINFERMRNYRLKRAVDQLNKDGLGALITWDGYNIRYLTGIYTTVPTRWAEGWGVIVLKDGSYYVDAQYLFVREVMLEEMPWLKEHSVHGLSGGKTIFNKAGWENTAKTVAKIMADHGVSNLPLGLDGCTSELIAAEAFKDVGIKCVDGKQTMFEARKIKNKDEIECIRIACANADAAFADIVDAIRPGVKECELVGVGMKRLYTEGTDEAMEFVCAAGQRTNPLHIDYTDTMVQPGDLIVIDINGNSWQGYKSCYYRTFCCGKATAEQAELYEECRNMMYTAINGIKAGNTTWDIVKRWPDSPKYWGYERWDQVMGMALGHGIGIPLHEIPFFNYLMSKDNPVKLEEGMVLAVETWTGKRGGKDGVRLEEDVVVTKDGYEVLTRWPVDKLTECWR